MKLKPTLRALLATTLFFLTATASLLMSANTRLSRIIDRLRTVLKELEDATILNLNNSIASQGTLQSEFTDDGVHLNEAAYDVWASMVKATMAGGDSFRPPAPSTPRRR